jgi:glutamate/tyrosine decarboxylase-like PLP-dependent enzyme
VNTTRLDELRQSLETPPGAFDWDESDWQAAGARFLEFATGASVDWDARSPAGKNHDEVRRTFSGSLPEDPVPLDDLVARLETDLLPASAFNGHPRFFAYITASATPVGVLGNLAATAINQNVGNWRVAPGASAIELQTIGWVKDILGLPSTAQGLFVSGGQMANIVAWTVFRDTRAPWDIREHGVRGPDGNAPRLRAYASKELHYCHEQAADLLGLGGDAVRHVDVDENYRIRLDSLAAMIAEDRARGDLPIAVVGTAGTVGTGAVDPIPELRRLADAEDLWLHIDGAYGAFAVLAESCPPDLKAIADADSVACDPHKWLFQPIDAGIAIVREPGLLERSFAFHPAYLETGHNGAHVNFIEIGPENSRPLRALKVWLSLQAYGRSGYAAMIDYNIRLSAYMEELVKDTPCLVPAAPRELSIVCWRAEPPGLTGQPLEDLQLAIIDEIERRGIAMVSNAKLHDGRNAIRACITNFRTRPSDVEATVQASAEIAADLAN